jgi:general secretion pathway protein G
VSLLHSSRSNRPGFSLLELMVVIAIMSALAAVVAPVVFRHVGDARVQAARNQIEIFSLALDTYYADATAYPTTHQGLDALRRRPVVAPQPLEWRGPYLKREVPLDPWGRPYEYRFPGARGPHEYEVFSYGRDGAPGGEGEDADIGTVAESP